MSALLVAYDIPDDGRRTKVAKALFHFGRRVQYSVFLLRHADANDVAEAIAPLIVTAEDNIRIHPLCASCEEKARLLGLARGAGLPEGFRIV